MTTGTKAELFKKLQLGTKVLTRWTDPNTNAIGRWFEREVVKVNSTGAQFNDNSWLRKDAFNADQVYTLDMSTLDKDGKNVFYTPFADYSIVE